MKARLRSVAASSTFPEIPLALRFLERRGLQHLEVHDPLALHGLRRERVCFQLAGFFGWLTRNQGLSYRNPVTDQRLLLDRHVATLSCVSVRTNALDDPDHCRSYDKSVASRTLSLLCGPEGQGCCSCRLPAQRSGGDRFRLAEGTLHRWRCGFRFRRPAADQRLFLD